jgi:hypothetical protein
MHFDLRKACKHYKFDFAQPWMLKSYKVEPFGSTLSFFHLSLQNKFILLIEGTTLERLAFPSLPFVEWQLLHYSPSDLA